MFKWNRLMLAGVLVLLLVAIRTFEAVLFYDPLLQFFATTHTTDALPNFDMMTLVVNTSLRFLLNTLVSLAILWALFRDRDIIKLSSFLYAISFVVLLILFMILLTTSETGQHMFLFYVRRFLIQPLFLLVLIPAVYFQKKK